MFYLKNMWEEEEEAGKEMQYLKSREEEEEEAR